MKVIEAFWEKRNVGVETYEIILDNSDITDLSKVIEHISSNKYNEAYLVIKLPAPNVAALHYLEDNGFHFMEAQFHMKKSLQNYITPKFKSCQKNTLEQREIEKKAEKWKDIIALMTNDMFHTDRIYLDPKIKKGVSCKRYQNWIMDLVHDSESHLYVYYHKDAAIGFGVVKINYEKKVVDVLLEGIFEKYQQKGFGYQMYDCALKSYQNLGLENLETARSSNNVPILNLDHAFGYKIEKAEYVLRKFNTQDL